MNNKLNLRTVALMSALTAIASPACTCDTEKPGQQIERIQGDSATKLKTALPPTRTIAEPTVDKQVFEDNLEKKDPISGTNKEMVLLLKKARAEAGERPSWLEGDLDSQPISDSEKLLEQKFYKFINLKNQLFIGAGDLDFKFQYKGKKIHINHNSGESEDLSLAVGVRKTELWGYSWPLEKQLENGDTIKLSEQDISNLNSDLELIIAGLEDLLNAKPVYRGIKNNHPDIIQNDGLNLRHNDGDLLAKVDRGSYFQILGTSEKAGYVDVYFVRGGEIRTGKVYEKFLSSAQDSFDKNKDEKIEQVVISKMKVSTTSEEGLKLRENPGRRGRVITRIPNGTTVEVVAKEANALGQWAQVRYEDPKTGGKMEGWSCIYQGPVRYLHEIR